VIILWESTRGESAMSDSKKQPSYSDTIAEFKALLEDMPAYFRQAREGQRRILLDFLANSKHSLGRKHPRKSCSIPVDFAAEDHAFTSLIQDIGPGGVFGRFKFKVHH
jgi:hypothetical protein